uniref:APC membrane recruitment protein 2 n=1 Tax=Geotrypetes seraphini TaxID=260995 RepID=A0A6P8RAF8_GEOSA|nr:APC membrane recruitment protein 2 [Geotrypetes seraphini]
MELQRDSAESPAAEQPPGKLNKTAFKLFGRRRAGGGGTMPSIFGVRNKGDGKNSGSNGAAATAATTTTTGLVRSRTHEGLAEVTLESDGERRLTDSAAGTVAPRADAAVAKSHSFLSLLKKNARCEGGRGEKQHAEPRQRKGLRGLLHSIRWHRRARAGEESSDSPPDLILPCSLTASLECVQEEEKALRKPSSEPANAPEEAESAEAEPPRQAQEPAAGSCPEPTSPPAAEDITGEEEDAGRADERQLPGPGGQEEGKDGATTGEMPVNAAPLVEAERESARELAAPDPPSERPLDRVCLMFADVTSLKSFDSLTGCGDSIADQEEEGGSASGGKNAPGAGRKAVFRKDPVLVTCQGGGEEMASPDGADDTCLRALWPTLPPGERRGEETEEEAPESGRCAEEMDPGAARKQGRLDRAPVKPGDESAPRASEAEVRRERAPSPEDSCGDVPVSAPESSAARDSCSGEAVLDLRAELGKKVRESRPDDETSRLPCSKPVIPLTTTCPLKTSSAFKESKIPISIKHLPPHPPSQGAETSSNSALASQQPTKSEMPRTKIPVSKVLVRRVSNRVLTGTALKATADTAKK